MPASNDTETSSIARSTELDQPRPSLKPSISLRGSAPNGSLTILRSTMPRPPQALHRG